MTQAATPGIEGGGGQNLRAAIASQAPPSNPRTPNDRTDPREETLLDQQRIRRAFEVAQEHRPGSEAGTDPLADLYRPMHAAITRLRDGTPIEDVTDALALAMFSLVSPKTKQQLLQMISPPPAPGGMAMPMGGPPPGGAGPGLTAGPPGPVSPGPPPG